MKQILNNHEGETEEAPVRWYLHEGDCLILDRGFRDSISDLEEWGYEVYMPPSLGRNERQLSTEAANKSRLITMVRWVVVHNLWKPLTGKWSGTSNYSEINILTLH